MRVLLVVAVSALVVAGACASGGDDQNSAGGVSTSIDSTAGAKAALEQAVRSYTDAFLGGDGEAAWNLLTDRCHDANAKNDFLAIVAQGHDQYGDAKITSYKAELNGTTALASYELTDPILNQTKERWVFENRGWHNDEC
jgi:hypothetical protein